FPAASGCTSSCAARPAAWRRAASPDRAAYTASPQSRQRSSGRTVGRGRGASVVVHPHSLELIEFPRVAAALAARATSPRAAAALLAATPRPNAADRALACARLDEAIRRQREPGAWCFAAPSALADVLAGDARDAFEPEAFRVVGDWLEANARTRAA